MHIERKFRNHTITILVLLLTLTSGLYLATRTVPRAQAVTATPATFTNYELAGNPFATNTNPPFSVRVNCPNSAGNCQNTEGEPAIRADRAGNFYGSSENVFCVIGGQCGGTFSWKSIDGGNSFTTLKLPNSASGTVCNPPTGVDHCTSTGLSPAGGDTDLAVAPRKNSNGFYNLYVASLASVPALFTIYVSVSMDGGANWVLNKASSIPVDDREWIAADGANRVCISYHATGTTNQIIVDCGTVITSTGLIVFDPPKMAFDATHQFHALFNNQIGNLAIDPGNHVIYQVFSSIGDASEEVPITGCGISCGTHAVWLARSIDGGITFSDFPVYNNSNHLLSYGHQFVNVSVDKAGNVYVVYSDDHNLFYSFSTTFGQNWSGPFQINKPDSNTAIFPWSAAGNAGQLDVVWYGTSYYDGKLTPDTYPSVKTTDPASPAAWYVYFSQNLAATTSNNWVQVKASGINHYGGVCESGVTCTGNRDLLDDFGVVASPTTGKAVIIYTSDQFQGSAAEPATTRTSGSPVCDLALSNTVDCSHTDIAVQTGGSTVNQHPGNFEEDGEDFEETNVSDNGGSPQPHEEIDMTNTGTVAINKFDVKVGGLPWTLTWSSASPTQPGQSVRATSNSVPAGLLLTVGTIYTVAITATMADGTTETHTVNAIYTLGAGLGL